MFTEQEVFHIVSNKNLAVCPIQLSKCILSSGAVITFSLMQSKISTINRMIVSAINEKYDELI